MTTATRLTPAELLLGELTLSSLALLERLRQEVWFTMDASTLSLSIKLSEQIDAASELIGKAPAKRQEAARN